MGSYFFSCSFEITAYVVTGATTFIRCTFNNRGLSCVALPYFGAAQEAFCAVFLVGSYFLICPFKLAILMLTCAATFFNDCRVYAV
jgi:hypothetical protein